MSTHRGNAFLLKRLHSLSGVLPIGLFLMFHLFVNALSFWGPGVYNGMVQVIGHLPFLPVIEIVFLGLPLLYHIGYGIYITVTGSVNLSSYPYTRNWMYVLQRVTGFIAFVFIGYHVWSTTIQGRFFGADISFEMMRQYLQTPWILAVYAVGIVGAAFHFSNGLWSFCITWGITAGPRSQRGAGYACAVLFVAVSAMGLWALRGFFPHLS